jgi:hypothetical protein
MDSTNVTVIDARAWLLVVAVTWIALAIWLKRGRASGWIKIAVVVGITGITAAFFAPHVSDLVRKAQDLEAKRVEMERAADQILREHDRARR